MIQFYEDCWISNGIQNVFTCVHEDRFFSQFSFRDAFRYHLMCAADSDEAEVQTVWLCVCVVKIFCLVWRHYHRPSQPDSLSSRSDLNQFTNSIMLSPNTGWEMMNDYVKHIISLLHHHCNMAAKFHSSYPISSLFKERKLLVPVIRYVARLCARVKPTLPLRFLLCSGCSQIHTHTDRHTHTQVDRYTCSTCLTLLSSHIPFTPISRTII